VWHEKSTTRLIYSAAHRAARRLSLRGYAVDDLAHEAFVQLLRTGHRYSADRPLAPYVLTVAYRRWNELARRQDRDPWTHAALFSTLARRANIDEWEPTAVESSTVQPDTNATIAYERWLAALSYRGFDHCVDVVRTCTRTGCPREAAAVLGLSVRQVRACLMRAASIGEGAAWVLVARQSVRGDCNYRGDCTVQSPDTTIDCTVQST
jgi:DNA-directed RNA polymerase specialized sigma24 family protein